MRLFDFFKSKKKSSSSDGIVGIMITLDIDKEQVLFVLLAKDGSINRLGTGSEDNTEKDLFIGVTNTKVFELVRKKCSPVIDEWIGGFVAPEIIGKSCTLVIGFQTSDGKELMSQWNYGSKSQGPPPAVASVVIESVQATEIWFQNQKKMTKSSN